jgi:DNA (cytosine-5)-methyltransferase 1
MDFDVETFVAHTLRGTGHDASEDGTGRGVPLIPVVSSGRGWWDESEVGATLRAQDSVTKADTLAIAYQCHGSNVGEMGTLRKGSGSVTGGVPFVAQAFNWQSGGDCRGLDPQETSGALTKMQTPDTLSPYGVRRLTPREMERLQGFPDDYTLLPVALRKPIEDDYFAYLARTYPEMSRSDMEQLSKDGPRAKALGNSMAVPVMRWIGQRIALVDGVP